jgi:hypothetical protein
MSNVPGSFVSLARPALLRLLLVTSASPAVNAEGRDAPAVRMAIVPNGELAAAIVRARDGASRRLALESCAHVLNQFSDGDGRSLRDVLSGRGLSAASSLTPVIFRDGDAAPTCRSGPIAAFTSPGSNVVFVCGKRFARLNKERAELVVVHELLHTLGLQERPPLPGEIDRAIASRCEW